MIGQLWSAGITLAYNERGKWWARADFQDDGHCQDNSVWLKIGTSYAQGLEITIDTLLTDAKSLGLKFTGIDGPCLFVPGDHLATPDNWMTLLQEQAARIGWETYK